jgi:pyrimidine-specific ribonucleoside hydrolase
MRRTTGLAALLLVVAACSSSETAPPTTPSTTAASSTTTTTTPPDPRTPVLLDYSPTVSDVGALVFLASHPDLRLVAVTLPGTGESYCEPGVAHTRGVLELLGLGDVPVACGPDDPITGWNAFPTSWRVGSNQIDLPEAEPNETRTAPELLADVVTESRVPVEIVAVGPLTNLAVAFEDDPSLAARVAGITIMGGAVDVPGNVFRNDVGEWNIWVDPTAAGMVFASGAPVTLVPLDATNHLPANRTFFEALDAAAEGPGSVLVRDLIAGDEFWLAGGFFFWDELAAAVLVDESLVEFETRTLLVDDTERETKGWTREDPTGTDIRVAVSADRRAFEQLFLDTLVGAPTELGYLEATAEDVAYFEALEQITREASAGLDAIFEEVATDLGVDLASDDGAFFAVVGEALPRVFAGPWQDRIQALEALEPPSDLGDAHAMWIEALRAMLDSEEALLAALESEDFDAIDARFEQVTEACRPIRDGADLRLITAVFDCA